MEWKTLPAAEWLPDQPDFGNPGIITAQNCVPGANGYLPLSASTNFSIALTTASSDFVRGGFSMKDASGNTRVFAGDASNLYEQSASGWANVSVSANTYSGTGTTEVWKFIQWGNTIIASNYNNAPQQLSVGAGIQPFAVMSGSPPRFRYGGVIKDHVVVANLFESSAAYPQRVRWSGFNNANYWAFSQRLQADFQDLPDGGPITGFMGGEFGVIWQENAIRRMTYAGPEIIFRFDTVSRQHGTRYPNTICRYGNTFFYLSDEDIYAFDGFNSPEPLGAEKVIRFLLADISAGYMNRVGMAYNHKWRALVLTYPNSSATAGHPNRSLIYSLINKRWSLANIEMSYPFNLLSFGYTLDGLDAVSTNINNLQYSLDSPVWQGGSPFIGSFGRGNTIVTYDGSPMTATVDTTELRSAPGRRLEITNTRPLVEGGTAQIQISTRELQSNSASWTAAVGTNARGECNQIISGRFAKIRIIASGAWKYLQGADVYMREAGRG